ncbi:molybdopterin-synthase adenylyltransferase MoeB [Cytophaga aurantiaca]|uniref:molybdopterin-synthase adenylyltransferase MoeB n=1 Tax=Cytophaga aurantiaca TaxID=29530 RepID=UPI00035E0FAF|nr:molybdopterin-synthase adenylyltransferase MoeB [Cytophaga aurantiaca]
MRYSRQTILPEVGIEGQQKLTNASVLVVGAGGLGSPVLLYLAAAGVGRLGIIDADKVDVTNLQRQVIYVTEDEGKSKAETAAKHLNALNPEINIDVYPVWLSKDNALDIFSKYDIVVDGSDNFATRYLVNDACVMLNKPLVFGSIFKFEGQVSVFNYKGGPTYRCLFPEPPAAGEVPNCSEIGVIGVLPGIIGTLQANEVIKIILEKGDVLNGVLYMYDALSNDIQKLKVFKDPVASVVTELGTYEEVCETSPDIDKKTLDAWKEKNVIFQLIDVREPHEFEQKNIGGELIPMNTVKDNLNRIREDIPVIVHCQMGGRSRKVVDFLYEKGFKNVYNLKGGLKEF